MVTMNDLRKVQKSHAANREGSFKVEQHIPSKVKHLCCCIHNIPSRKLSKMNPPESLLAAPYYHQNLSYKLVITF